MADGGDGFVGRCEVVEPLRRGKRRWSTETKARIVAESLQPGARVVDVVLGIPGEVAVERAAALVRTRIARDGMIVEDQRLPIHLQAAKRFRRLGRSRHVPALAAGCNLRK